MKKGFVFIETIIVITILTVGLISIYANYSKIISNTKELNTFDIAEYNYKTYFLKNKYSNNSLINNAGNTINSSSTKNQCYIVNSPFSDNKLISTSAYNQVKVCLLENVSTSNYIATHHNKLDAYIIDYINNNDFHTKNDNIFLVEYKKADKQIHGEYFTYISSLNY